MTKVKSHRKFDEAKDLDDLWRIARNACADNEVLAAYNAIPLNIGQLSEGIAAFTVCEKKMLQNHMKFLVDHNKLRLNVVSERPKDDNNGPSVCPKMARHRRDGLFDPSLSGNDALDALIAFTPAGYEHRASQDFEDDRYHLCLQGANIAKAFKLWCDLLKWPNHVAPDYDAIEHGDWGISWFELMINFYLCAGWRCPIKTDGRLRILAMMSLLL